MFLLSNLLSQADWHCVPSTAYFHFIAFIHTDDGQKLGECLKDDGQKLGECSTDNGQKLGEYSTDDGRSG
jgi:hypothetical protein